MFTQFSCVYLLQCFASCGSFCMEYICNLIYVDNYVHFYVFNSICQWGPQGRWVI